MTPPPPSPLLVLLLVLAVGGPSPLLFLHPAHALPDAHDQASYSFAYAVDAPQYQNFHDREEARLGKETRGRFRVALPDNRLQTVTYKADDNGYTATISYDQHPNFAALRESVGPIRSAPEVGQSVLDGLRRGENWKDRKGPKGDAGRPGFGSSSSSYPNAFDGSGSSFGTSNNNFVAPNLVPTRTRPIPSQHTPTRSFNTHQHQNQNPRLANPNPTRIHPTRTHTTAGTGRGHTNTHTNTHTRPRFQTRGSQRKPRPRPIPRTKQKTTATQNHQQIQPQPLRQPPPPRPPPPPQRNTVTATASFPPQIPGVHSSFPSPSHSHSTSSSSDGSSNPNRAPMTSSISSGDAESDAILNRLILAIRDKLIAEKAEKEHDHDHDSNNNGPPHPKKPYTIADREGVRKRLAAIVHQAKY